jgi:hypothetical protein
VDNIEMHLIEIEWSDMDWIDLAQDKEQGNEPSGSIKCCEILQ